MKDHKEYFYHEKGNKYPHTSTNTSNTESACFLLLHPLSLCHSKALIFEKMILLFRSTVSIYQYSEHYKQSCVLYICPKLTIWFYLSNTALEADSSSPGLYCLSFTIESLSLTQPPIHILNWTGTGWLHLLWLLSMAYYSETIIQKW